TFLFAQTIAPKKCNTCGKPLAQCQYKGKHPKQKTPTSAGNRNDAAQKKRASYSKGDLILNTNPQDATVLIDGNIIGQTPLSGYELKTGNYLLKIKKRGYTSIEKQIIVESGKNNYDFSLNYAGSKGTHVGHDWVDMGLPSDVKWATCNIGANKPSEEGNYYAWGECTTKFPFKWSNYKYIDKCEGDVNSSVGKKFTKYNTPWSAELLEKADDAASQNWGGNWRMPTKKEYDELIDNCTWKAIVLDGKWGLQATSKNNGNILFFTATVDCSEFFPIRRTPENFYADYSKGNFGGKYWTSTIYNNVASGQKFHFWSTGPRKGEDWNFRYEGLVVRPVVEL
ncbi:MAG: PEGA domain-containing protein, partial [Prevotellaceae bacterium]|nr:PEGA domain-containing protein [Candidatus Colivivens equi]